ncbi:MAG TPA: SIMPL domain-containing protein [Stellaceae bacterium]|nr:SIMPL domain-containing protein [Stellaceae bacterium]
MSLVRSLIFGLMAAAAAVPAAAQTAPAASTTTMLHLSETAERNAPNDRLRVQLAAEYADRDATKVQAEINRRMGAALKQIKATPDIAVETEGYSVYEERSDKAPPQWHGSQTISLTAKDFAQLLSLVGGLQQDGLVVKGMAPELSREARRAVEDSLTDEALGRLRQRAAHIAATLGTKVAGMREVRIGNAASPPVPLRAMAMARAMPAPVAEPGEAKVSVTVSADIALTPQP